MFLLGSKISRGKGIHEWSSTKQSESVAPDDFSAVYV
jgi:hypothetical protein